jgi:hypothetical protein
MRRTFLTEAVHLYNTAYILGFIYEGLSRSFRTGSLERELQMVQLSVTRWSCIAILWVSLVSFAAVILCVVSQRVFIIVVDFVTDSNRKLLDTSSYVYTIYHIYIYIYILDFLQYLYKSRDGSVGIALGYGLDDRGSRVRFPVGLGIFLFTTESVTALGPTQPPIQWIPWALSLEVKRPGREADHSPPSSAEVEECVELYLHSPNTFSWRDAQLKHRDKLTFSLTPIVKFLIMQLFLC